MSEFEQCFGAGGDVRGGMNLVDKLTNIDRFNLVVAHIFTRLLEAFPVPGPLELDDAIRAAFPALGLDEVLTQDQEEFVIEAGEFLNREGFLSGDPFDLSHGAQLTTKTLLILQVVPEGIRGPTTSLGERLKATTETATINQTVGQIFGIAVGAARGIIGIP
ncbi:hypothetical protein [Amorphus sp. MBR-141]